MRHLRSILAAIFLITACFTPGICALGLPEPSSSIADQTVKCPKCDHENRAGIKFCVKCGNVLRKGGCPHCGAETHPGDVFCGDCGFDLATTKMEPAAKEQKPETVPPEGGQPTSSGDGGPQLKIIGFADTDFRATDRKDDHNAFNLGQFDLFVNSRLSPVYSVLAEIVTEANDQNAFGTELERLLITGVFNENFQVSLGRYHTAIGYYNTAYHHGTFLQTAVGRPFLFAFEDEGGPLPVHNVGLSISGQIPGASRLGAGYTLQVGNGRTSRSPMDEPVQNAVDENNGKAVNLALTFRPDGFPGFQAGISAYHDSLHPAGKPDTDKVILAGHAVLVRPNFEWLNEAVLIRHAASGMRTFDTPAWYTQVARQYGKARPYFRYQWINAPGADPIIGDIGLRHGPSIGVRYELADFMAIKLQWDRTWQRGMANGNDVIFQSSFTF